MAAWAVETPLPPCSPPPPRGGGGPGGWQLLLKAARPDQADHQLWQLAGQLRPGLRAETEDWRRPLLDDWCLAGAGWLRGQGRPAEVT